MKIVCYAEPTENGLLLHYPSASVKAELLHLWEGAKEKYNGYFKIEINKPYSNRTTGERKPELEIYTDGFKDGYNKANEWHFVKDGDLPPENTKVLALMADKEICIAYFYRRNVWDKIGTVIAWKEIVLPELPKESE